MMNERTIPSPGPDYSMDDLMAEAEVNPEPPTARASYRAVSGKKLPDLLLARQILDADLLLTGTHGRRWLNHWLSEPVAGEVSPEAEIRVGDASSETAVRTGP
ncbi:hypothetical protein [Deinococcus sp. UYEF24]